jgi:hypothetical protein
MRLAGPAAKADPGVEERVVCNERNEQANT